MANRGTSGSEPKGEAGRQKVEQPEGTRFGHGDADHRLAPEKLGPR